MMVQLDNTVARPVSSSVKLRALFIDGRSEWSVRVADLFQDRLPNLRALHARSLADARRILARENVDLIATSSQLPDGRADLLLDVFVDQGPVFIYNDADGRSDDVLDEHPRVLDRVRVASNEPPDVRCALHYLRAVQRLKSVPQRPTMPAEDVLRRVRSTLSRVNHDLNNPLSIISGNAQLLSELAKALNLDGDLVQPIQDIEEASLRVSGILRRLVELKDALPIEERSAQDVRSELRDMQAQG